MKPPDLSSRLADTFDIDFKAEVVAGEMLDSELQTAQLMIISLGSMKRSFRKDVDEIIEELSDYNNKEYTIITTHKEGIYDMLPEGLFHSPALPKTATTQKEIIDSIKKHRVEERNARRFFLPYEAGINHLRIQMAMYESRLDKGSYHTELVDVFKSYWEIFRWLNKDQANIFLQVLPLIHDTRDDYAIAETIFALIFSIPVTITGRRQQVVKAADPFFSVLNDTLLGINFTTGNAAFYGGEDEIIVTLGPIDNEQLSQFEPGSTNSKILELLCDYFLPVHLEITTSFSLRNENKITRLTNENNDFNSTLGLSTYL